MKKNLKYVLLAILLLSLGLNIYNLVNRKTSKASELPKPELSEGLRGTFGIDKNINETTIDNYLNRSDSVYRDMRMLRDPGNYEAIGGDSYLSGLIKGLK